MLSFRSCCWRRLKISMEPFTLPKGQISLVFWVMIIEDSLRMRVFSLPLVLQRWEELLLRNYYQVLEPFTQLRSIRPKASSWRDGGRTRGVPHVMVCSTFVWIGRCKHGRPRARAGCATELGLKIYGPQNLLRPCLVHKNFWFGYCSTFVFIWQTLSNHRVTRLKRFISRFTDKLCN